MKKTAKDAAVDEMVNKHPQTKTKRQPPKGPGGTPKPDQKPMESRRRKSKQPEVNEGDKQKQFALQQAYAGMRTMGHAPLVALAMMNAISNGFDLAAIEDAAKAHGDLK